MREGISANVMPTREMNKRLRRKNIVIFWETITMILSKSSTLFKNIVVRNE